MHLGVPLGKDNATPFVLSASAGVLVDVLGMDLDAEGPCNWLVFPLSGVIDIHFNIQGDFSLIQDKGDQFLITRTSNGGTLFDWRYEA